MADDTDRETLYLLESFGTGGRQRHLNATLQVGRRYALQWSHMADVQTENRFSQALLHLPPDEISIVQRALVALSDDPFRGKMLAGADNSYLLRASDQLRIIYRIERRLEGENSASPVIVAEDLISGEALRRYLPGGAVEAF